MTHDCIVGVDFLQRYGFDIRYSTNSLETGCTTTPLLLEKPTSMTYRVAVHETVVVPPYHEMIIPADVIAKGEAIPDTCGLVEGRLEFVNKRELVIARSLVNVASGQVPARVANPTGTAITVYQSTHIGCFCPVQAEARELTVPVHSCEVKDVPPVP